MKSFRNHKNSSRIQFRQNGKFYRPTLSDFGYDVCADYSVCSNCGYGNEEQWVPLLKTGICPKCKCQDKIPLEFAVSKLLCDLREKYNNLVSKPFISPFDLPEISRLEREMSIERSNCIKSHFLKGDKDN